MGSSGMKRKGPRKNRYRPVGPMPRSWRFWHATWRTSELRDELEVQGQRVGFFAKVLGALGRLRGGGG